MNPGIWSYEGVAGAHIVFSGLPINILEDFTKPLSLSFFTFRKYIGGDSTC